MPLCIGAFARALAHLALGAACLCVPACGGDAGKKTRVTMRMRPDCQFLVMPEECMEAVVVDEKPKGFTAKWF